MKQISLDMVDRIAGGVLLQEQATRRNSCADHASNSFTQVDGILGFIGVADGAKAVFGNDYQSTVEGYFYEGCLSAGVYGTNKNLDSYDPQRICGYYGCVIPELMNPGS